MSQNSRKAKVRFIFIITEKYLNDRNQQRTCSSLRNRSMKTISFESDREEKVQDISGKPWVWERGRGRRRNESDKR